MELLRASADCVTSHGDAIGTPCERWRSAPNVLILLAIVSVGTVLRCHRLGEISFWFDESFCWKMTTFDWNELWDRVARDNHPPLYFLLLKLWALCWGETAVAMRSLSVICGGAVIIGGFMLVRETEFGLIADERRRQVIDVPALLAAASLAIAPLQIEWSQQVRMYALGSALTLWSSWLLLRALQHHDSNWKHWCVYGLAVCALAYTHYYSLFIIATQFVFAVGASLSSMRQGRLTQFPGASFKYVALTFAMIAMGWAPWLPEFLSHRKQVTDFFWTRPLKADEVAWVCVQIWIGVWSEWPFHAKLAWGVTGVSFAIWCGQLLFGCGGLRLIALGPLVTFAAAVLTSLGSRNILSVRYFVFAHALAVCGIAVSVQRLPSRWLRGTCSGLFLIGLSYLCLENVERRDRWATRPGFESAIAYLDEVRQPNEPVLVGNPMVYINVAAYITDRENVHVLSEHQHFPYFQGTAVMRDSEYITSDSVSHGTSPRVWVIDTNNWTGGSFHVRLPTTWVDIREESFYDWHSPNCQIIVKECLRRRSAASGDHGNNSE